MSTINYHKTLNAHWGKVTVTIDPNSGFCFGVVNAIQKAEAKLINAQQLQCLGSIVHNNEEVNRLKAKGLVTIGKSDFEKLNNTTVLFRAHGEPPENYNFAQKNNIEIIDATCPVVLKLQQRIKAAWLQPKSTNAQIAVIGKKGHAEVIGLVGQTQNEAIVIESIDDICLLDRVKPVIVFAQTTISIDKFNLIVEAIKNYTSAIVTTHDTICRQVSNRAPKLNEFAKQHQLIVFVGGTQSSNAKYLYQVCLQANEHTFFVPSINDIQAEWLQNVSSIGICGATSTPLWLMEQVAEHIENYLSKPFATP